MGVFMAALHPGLLWRCSRPVRPGNSHASTANPTSAALMHPLLAGTQGAILTIARQLGACVSGAPCSPRTSVTRLQNTSRPSLVHSRHQTQQRGVQGEARATLFDASAAGTGAQVHSIVRAAKGAVHKDLLAAVTQVPSARAAPGPPLHPATT